MCPASRTRGTVHDCRRNLPSASLWAGGLVALRSRSTDRSFEPLGKLVQAFHEGRLWGPAQFCGPVAQLCVRLGGPRGAVPQSSLATSMGATKNFSLLRSCAFRCSLAGAARVEAYVERDRSLRPVPQRRCIRPFSPSTDGVATAVAVPYMSRNGKPQCPTPPHKSADGDPSPFPPLPPLLPGFRYQRVRNPWHASSPPPALEPATAGFTCGTAFSAVGAERRPPSAPTGADTAAATSQPGGAPTTAGGCASLPEWAATIGVDAVAPAKSGAALGVGDAIEVEEAAPTPSKKTRTDRRTHLAGLRRASELGVEMFVRRLHTCRVKDALSSGKTPPPNTPLLSYRSKPVPLTSHSQSRAHYIHSRELTTCHGLVWAAFRSCASSRSLFFLRNTPFKYVPSDILAQECDISWIESVFFIVLYIF